MKFLKIAITLTLLAISMTAFSQITFGARVGINIASQTTQVNSLDINLDSDDNVGFTIGGLVNIAITDAFSIQPELNYIQKGGEDESELFGETITTELNLNYIEIPVLAKYAFGSETFKVFVMAGPSIGYGLNGEITFDDEESEDFDWDEEGANRTDFGFQAGVGVQYRNIFLDARYGFGLSDIEDLEDDVDVTNEGINIGIGYMF